MKAAPGFGARDDRRSVQPLAHRVLVVGHDVLVDTEQCVAYQHVMSDDKYPMRQRLN